ncbi:MAG: Eco57I restriction-modification methylase domain-containing protein, partial [Nitrosospira sp.]|nr:Eco57I restriction-modification methylase domain-containing protein [Nitrosospira sp.]
MPTVVKTRPALQASLPGMCPVEGALELLASAGIEERGAIFTRREVIDFILDLVGYTPDKELHKQTLLEPSFGEGDFLLTAIARMIAAWRHHAPVMPASDLAQCICAVELHQSSYTMTRAKVVATLRRASIAAGTAEALANAWLRQGDFLLADLPTRFSYVVGNPPYVRQELIPDALLAEYRARYRTMFDRADIYIPFIERSLGLLAQGGALSFICADRWMKNRYGGPLRRMVADRYRLKVYVDMVDTPAFHSDVIAYPAITVITREKPGSTRIAHRPEISAKTLGALAADLTAEKLPPRQFAVKEMAGVAEGDRPWILESSDQVALVRRLERDFPAIEDAGCKVGIGVATGADDAFIGPFDTLDVEDDRKLPLVMTRDIFTGSVQWRGYGIVNPFVDQGGLVDLARYPRLRLYLEARKDEIAGRHVAKKAPANWYRTIDRIYPALAAKP